MSLISLERAQKLDLLIHLISNLSQSLVLCGPRGIGKTTLLETLRETKNEAWPICWVNAKASTSFESIQQQFENQLTNQVAELQGKGLSMAMAQLQQESRKFVLVIDDAGALVPGLITSLIQFANVTPELRLILALTHDELHVKNSSDTMIDECHFIEIPPLTLKQCMTFLQNLSGQQDANISFNAINEKMVENLYRETHGIPGRIMQELPSLSKYQDKSSGFWLWGSMALMLLAIVSGIYFWGVPSDDNQVVVFQSSELESRDPVDRLIVPVDVIRQPPIPVSAPPIETEERFVGTSNAIQPQENQTKDEHATSLVNLSEAAVGTESEKHAVDSMVTQVETAHTQDDGTQMLAQTQENKDTQPQQAMLESSPPEPVLPIPEPETITQAEEQEVETVSEVTSSPLANFVNEPTPQKPQDDSLWLTQQAGQDFTLQLIVLSDKQAAARFVKRYDSLSGQLKIIKAARQGSAKFVVLYGSFADRAVAESAKKQLPKKLRKAWLRPFAALQN